MNVSVKLSDVFGKNFVEEVKHSLPIFDEVMQYSVISWIVKELAYFIYRQSPEAKDSFRRSKDIVLEELGECCQMIHTVCEGEHDGFYICSDNVRPL